MAVRPAWPVRMVASDLDGTLIRRDGTVSAHTVAVLAACRAAGVDVVAVTGRPARWLADLGDVVGTATAICANGALVYDLAAQRVIAAHTIANADVQRAVAAVRKERPGVRIAVETLKGFRYEPSYVPRYSVPDAVVAPLPELLADSPGVLKILMRCDGAHCDTFLTQARAALVGLAEPTHSGVGGGLVEVSALGVSKASSLAELAAARGIDASEVAAFGDMPNDLAMLGWAGHSYAMADGHPEVVAAASAVAPACEEDGVAQVLEDIVLGRSGGRLDGHLTSRG